MSLEGLFKLLGVMREGEKVSVAGFEFARLSEREKDHGTYVKFHQVTLDMKGEFKRAVDKHTLVQTPAHAGMSNGARLAILVEEVGEVARAMTYDEGSTDNLISELIQVATMAAAAVVGIRSRLQSS